MDPSEPRKKNLTTFHYTAIYPNQPGFFSWLKWSEIIPATGDPLKF